MENPLNKIEYMSAMFMQAALGTHEQNTEFTSGYLQHLAESSIRASLVLSRSIESYYEKQKIKKPTSKAPFPLANILDGMRRRDELERAKGPTLSDLHLAVLANDIANMEDKPFDSDIDTTVEILREKSDEEDDDDDETHEG
jgi:hypothetical protein